MVFRLHADKTAGPEFLEGVRRHLEMKRLILTLSMVLGSASVNLPAQTALTSVAAIHALSNAQASRHLAADFEATVTYFRAYERTLFVQDGETGIYVNAGTALKLMPGDRVRIKGVTNGSFRPFVQSNAIERLGHGSMPWAAPATFDDLIQARYDCRLVTVRGTVHSADVLNVAARNASLQVAAEGGVIDVTLDSENAAALARLQDAEVEITGAASGRFDGKMQQTGVLLHVSSIENIHVIRPAAISPWSRQATPMDEILSRYHVDNRTQRVRVHGTITYYQPGSMVVLQDGPRSLCIRLLGRNDLRVGDVADATGIPDVHEGFLTLTQAEVRDTGIYNPVSPQPSTRSELTLSHHIFDLVTIKGRLVVAVREGAQDEYVILSDGQVFSAILRHPTVTFSSTAPPALPAMKQIPVGSTVQVTGVCIQENSNPFEQNVPFDLMMRGDNDISILVWPSWLTVQNLARVMSLMTVMILAVTAWGWTLRRKVRKQTEALAARAAEEAETERQNAHLQQQRSQILEDINGTLPLVDVLEEITELVSFQLHGSACWCEVADGARLGRYPANTAGMRILRESIAARSGTPLGTISAAIDRLSPPAANEKHVFFVGSQLAALAIENRRLYSDLVHRSEFDLLTDVHNRFSLERQLDGAITRARETAGVFGLIYVDLDDFKQVNDVYGHRVGDLYLKEISARMKRQLRSADLLARVGGDEFAVLVPMVRNREDVVDIASRLDGCFAPAVHVEGCVLRGSASLGIALYPDDGVTRDTLMSAADAAMYVAKNMRRIHSACS